MSMSQLRHSRTSRGQIRYEIEVHHSGLNRYQVIRGADRNEVMSKAQAQVAQWDGMWKKQLERQQRAMRIEEKKELADVRTKEAQEALRAMERILTRSLHHDSTLDWESLKSHSAYSIPCPDKDTPLPKPQPFALPRGVRESEPKRWMVKYVPKLSPVDRLSQSRREAKKAEASARFERDFLQWQEVKAQEIAEYALRVEEYEAAIKTHEDEHREEVARWQKEREQFFRTRDSENASVDEKRSMYRSGDPDAIVDYYDNVLSRSEYPDSFPKLFDLDYKPESRLLLVEYEFPPISAMPTLRQVKYVQTRDEFTESHIPKSELNRLYDSVLYQATLRTVHEVFSADQIDAISLIVFNGYVHSIDPATGQETTPCVLSVQVARDEFRQINLASVDPKACFKGLKGIGSARLHSLTPIAPIMHIDRFDRRFVASYPVVEGLEEGDNLAAMDWQDFEHLIRELFELEFGRTGGEVEVTRASRDYGVDAIAFDPDPIRGGKIVIQAKRYTNTVWLLGCP